MFFKGALPKYYFKMQNLTKLFNYLTSKTN